MKTQNQRIFKTYFFTVVILLAFCFQTNASARGVSPAPSKIPKPPCRLQVEDPHFSGSLYKKKGFLYVKANVSSVCDSPQSQVTITVQLFKKGRFNNHLVAQRVFRSNKEVAPSLEISVKDVFALCVTKEPTRYETHAFSKALIKGEWQYARETKSHLTETIPCGTKSLNPIS